VLSASMRLSRVYLRLAWLNPVTWLALSGALLYTLLATMGSLAALRSAGLSLQLIEIAFYVFNDAYFVTYGLLFTFTIIASGLFDSPEFERLAAHRMPSRRGIWLARLIALLGMAVVFLASVGVVFLAAALPHHWASADWSDAYRSAVTAAQHSPDTLDPVRRLAADGYLLAHATPLGVLGFEVAIFLVVFYALGVASAAAGQVARRRATVVIVLLLYLLVYIGAAQLGYPSLGLLTPQSALLVGAHTPESQPHISFPVSLALWTGVAIAVSMAGLFLSRKTELG
jgi:hypothetical protein